MTTFTGANEPSVREIEWAIDRLEQTLWSTQSSNPPTGCEVQKALEPFHNIAFRSALHRRLFCPEFYTTKPRRFWCWARVVKVAENVYHVQDRVLFFWLTRRYDCGMVIPHYKPIEFQSEDEAYAEIAWNRAEPRLRKDGMFAVPADAN